MYLSTEDRCFTEIDIHENCKCIIFLSSDLSYANSTASKKSHRANLWLAALYPSFIRLYHHLVDVWLFYGLLLWVSCDIAPMKCEFHDMIRNGWHIGDIDFKESRRNWEIKSVPNFSSNNCHDGNYLNQLLISLILTEMKTKKKSFMNRWKFSSLICNCSFW